MLRNGDRQWVFEGPSAARHADGPRELGCVDFLPGLGPQKSDRIHDSKDCESHESVIVQDGQDDGEHRDHANDVENGQRLVPDYHLGLSLGSIVQKRHR